MAASRTRRQREIRRHVWIYGALTPYIVIAIFPIYWMAITAFKQDPDLYRMDQFPLWFHLPPTLRHFSYLFYNTNYGAWIVNTMVIAAWVAVITLLIAVPAGYALARLRLPWRSAILLAFLLPQAIPNLPVYVNIAQVFYQIGLNGTILGVVLVHASHGLVLAVWIASAAFASVDVSLEEASRNLGASPLTCFRTVTLPLAAPGLIASAIFVFLESLDEFTGTYFVGVPDVTTLPLLMFNASMGGNYQIASITALLLLIPSIGFMLVVERFLKADVLAMVGR